MNRIAFILIYFIFSVKHGAQVLALIPQPTSVTMKPGQPFLANGATRLKFDRVLEPMKDLLLKNPFYQNHLATDQKVANIIEVELASMRVPEYHLSINENKIRLTAGSPQAAITGIYTLIQLMALNKNLSGLSPAEIYDHPEYQYRGLHLDVSRHFLKMSDIKRFVDVMALYKFNQLHWHLTDGPGWRLEIEKYPLLTQKAAWRNYASWQDWWNNGRKYVDQSHPNAYGGYYTKKEAAEIVKYAGERGINVIPEIEMPGHSEEVLAVYPELSCTGIPYTSSELCLGNPATYSFAEEVLSEVLQIFPSQLIHIGGDEADQKHWRNCARCQSFMKSHGLKTEAELQGFFMKEISRFLISKGRTPVVWDEVAGSNLPKEAVIMNWRNKSHGAEAAKSGHTVIMTPAEFMYLDQYQSNPFVEPTAMGGLLPLSKVYSFDPAKDLAAERHLITGLQGNLWTEYIHTPEHLEYMAFPRALAIAEVGWSKPAQKDYSGFKARLQEHYWILNEIKVNYRRPSYDIVAEKKYNVNNQTFTIKLESEQSDGYIRYSTNGTLPDNNSTKYSSPFVINNSAVVRAALFKDSLRIGPINDLEVNFHKAIGKKVKYNTPWEGYPAHGEITLTNGNSSGKTYGDGEWQAFGSKGMEVVLDMEQERYTSIQIRFLHLPATGIHLPGEIRILLSEDDKTYTAAGSVSISNDPLVTKQTATKYSLKLTAPSQRLLKVVATNPKGGYIFTDEIVVN